MAFKLFFFSLLLLLAEGPVRHTCTVRFCPVRSNQMALLCDCCDLWTHARCCNVSSKAYQEFVLSQSFHWMCPRCLLSQLPFHDCSILLSCFDGAGVSPMVLIPETVRMAVSSMAHCLTAWVRVILG